MNILIKKKNIISALYQIEDPEIGLNIVDLGLIYQMMVDEHKVICEMSLTTPFCPMSESISLQVRNCLQYTCPHDEIEVIVTFNPEWTYDMISNEGKQQINYVKYKL